MISDAHRVLEKGTFQAKDNILNVKPYTINTEVVAVEKVVVTGITKDLSTDYLSLFFENERSGGGKIADISVDRATGNAVIQFESAEGI